MLKKRKKRKIIPNCPSVFIYLQMHCFCSFGRWVRFESPEAIGARVMGVTRLPRDEESVLSNRSVTTGSLPHFSQELS